MTNGRKGPTNVIPVRNELGHRVSQEGNIMNASSSNHRWEDANKVRADRNRVICRDCVRKLLFAKEEICIVNVKVEMACAEVFLKQ